MLSNQDCVCAWNRIIDSLLRKPEGVTCHIAAPSHCSVVVAVMSRK